MVAIRAEFSAMNTKGKSKRIICYGCGKIGHIKAKCKAKKDQNSKSDQKNSDSANKASDEKHETQWCQNSYCRKK